MIKRLTSAPKKKTGKSSARLRSKAGKIRRAAPVASGKAGREGELTLAAEQIFLMYDAAEAKHGKA